MRDPVHFRFHRDLRVTKAGSTGIDGGDDGFLLRTGDMISGDSERGHMARLLLGFHEGLKTTANESVHLDPTCIGTSGGGCSVWDRKVVVHRTSYYCHDRLFERCLDLTPGSPRTYAVLGSLLAAFGGRNLALGQAKHPLVDLDERAGQHVQTQLATRGTVPGYVRTRLAEGDQPPSSLSPLMGIVRVRNPLNPGDPQSDALRKALAEWMGTYAIPCRIPATIFIDFFEIPNFVPGMTNMGR